MIVDVYALCHERSAGLARSFISALPGDFEEVAVEYEFPQHSDRPETIFAGLDALFKQLERDQSQPYSLYWQNRGKGDIRTAMLFFTDDAGLIAGLSVPESAASNYLEWLGRKMSSSFGYVTYEVPPPDNTEDFIRCAKQAMTPRIVDDELF